MQRTVVFRYVMRVEYRYAKCIKCRYAMPGVSTLGHFYIRVSLHRGVSTNTKHASRYTHHLYLRRGIYLQLICIFLKQIIFIPFRGVIQNVRTDSFEVRIVSDNMVMVSVLPIKQDVVISCKNCNC